MRQRRIAIVGVLGAALVFGTMFAAAGAASARSKASASCTMQKDDKWPSWVQGQPAGINPKTSTAVDIWHDSNGWHIRVTHHSTNLRTFSGQLVTTGAFTGVRARHLEKSDTFQVSKDKHDITFLFKNYGFIDGLDFFTHCAPSIQFALQSDGKTSPPSKIIIGNGKVHPASDPFVISRTGPPPTSTTTTSTTTTSTTTTSTTSTTTSTTSTTTTTTTTTM